MRLIRRKEVETRTGLARSTIYLHIKNGKFPKPVKMGTHISCWVEEEINQYIDQCITASRKIKDDTNAK